MSHNDDIPERAARRHRPAIIGILVALAAAALLFVVFGWMGRDKPEPTRELAPGSATGTIEAPAATPDAPPAAATAPAATSTTAPASN